MESEQKTDVSRPVILVTGGAGYIGSHTCKALWQSGYHPVTVDNLVYGHESAVKWGPMENGEISDIGFVEKAFEQYKPRAVIHFAAYAYVGESVEDPAKYYLNNVAGTLSLLQACRSFGVGHFVFSSTCAIYGIPETLPIDEDQPQNPVNPYGASKLMVERVLRDYDRGYGLRSVSLRYFNAAGADPEGEIGELHDPETHLIPLVLDAIAGIRPTITIFGDDYPTPDGTCIRDYVHVSDLADAHVKSLDYLLRGGETTAFNLGTGSGYSVQEIVGAAERITGGKARPVIGARRQGDPAELVADASAAKRVLKWEPRRSTLDEIVRTAWSWCRKQSKQPQGE